ncbi:Leukocyte surface antigen CD53, partial [Nibea albiflora]
HMPLMQIDSYFEKDLMRSLEIYRQSSPEGNKTIRNDFDAVQHLGCLQKLRDWFARNYLSTGAGVVTMFIIQMCGVAVLGFGVYMMINFKLAALTPTLANFNLANMLLISGIVITCVSFLGFLGALKENRCLLLTFFLLLFFLMLVELTVACLLLVYEGEISEMVQKDLNEGLEKTRNSTDVTDWDLIQVQGCLEKLKNFFEENFLTTGISVIVLCIVEV